MEEKHRAGGAPAVGPHRALPGAVARREVRGHRGGAVLVAAGQTQGCGALAFPSTPSCTLQCLGRTWGSLP